MSLVLLKSEPRCLREHQLQEEIYHFKGVMGRQESNNQQTQEIVSNTCILMCMVGLPKLTLLIAVEQFTSLYGELLLCAVQIRSLMCMD